MQVVLRDVVQPLRRYPAPPRDVLEEWSHLLGPLGAAERQQQDGVELHYSNWVLAPPSA